MRRSLGYSGALLALALVGCDGDAADGGEHGQAGGEVGCVSDLEFFQKEISLAFMETDCMT